MGSLVKINSSLPPSLPPSLPLSFPPSLPPLSPSLSDPRYSILSNGSLIINSSHLGDSGCYTCTASNEAGNTSASVQLIATESGRPTAVAVAASLCNSSDRDDIIGSNTTTVAGACRHGNTDWEGGGVTDEGCEVLEDVSFMTGANGASSRRVILTDPLSDGQLTTVYISESYNYSIN